MQLLLLGQPPAPQHLCHYDAPAAPHRGRARCMGSTQHPPSCPPSSRQDHRTERRGADAQGRQRKAASQSTVQRQSGCVAATGAQTHTSALSGRPNLCTIRHQCTRAVWVGCTHCTNTVSLHALVCHPGGALLPRQYNAPYRVRRHRLPLLRQVPRQRRVVL